MRSISINTVPVCGKSEKALKINFCGFKICDSNPIQGRGAAQTMMYIRNQYTCSILLAIFFVAKPYQKNISVKGRMA